MEVLFFKTIINSLIGFTKLKISFSPWGEGEGEGILKQMVVGITKRKVENEMKIGQES